MPVLRLDPLTEPIRWNPRDFVQYRVKDVIKHISVDFLFGTGRSIEVLDVNDSQRRELEVMANHPS